MFCLEFFQQRNKCFRIQHSFIMFKLYSRVHAHCIEIMDSSLRMRASVQRNGANDDHYFVYGNTSNSCNCLDKIAVLNSNCEDGTTMMLTLVVVLTTCAAIMI